MELLETLVIGVGAGVAKGVLKVWFGAGPISEGVGNSLLDIIKSKTSDTDEQKKAEKQFEQIAKKVAQSIKDTITTRYPNIPEDRKVDIAYAAGQTVNTTTFSAQLLVQANLSPDALLVLYLKKPRAEGGHPALRDKSDNPARCEEFDSYRAILSEAAQLIVDGASQYPRFTKAVFSELLQGQDKHVQKFDLILDELKRIRQGRRGKKSVYDDFDEKYRRAVVRRLDELQLFGVDSAAATKRYKLTTAYVSLHVDREAFHGNDQNRNKQDVEGVDEDTTESVKVEQALAQTSRLFIRGGAGSGKTTLLQWVAVMSAARNFKDELAAWNDYVPFFIRVRDFARKDLPTPDNFARLISETLESAPAGWARNQLESGRAIVLVDGVDELPADRQDRMRKWLHDLFFDFADARYVLSSRAHAELKPKGFFDAELREMNSTDISSFIAHWHDAAREGLEDPETINELTELEEALRQRIQNSTAIYKLATTPLLCAVICALHRDRMRNIPEDRVELYEARADMFLRCDKERLIEIPQFPSLSSRQIKALLSDLAYWYIRNGVSLADVKGVDGRLQKKLGGFKNLPEGTNGTLVRRGLVARSGILRESSLGKVEFPHRTFQEFFAAKEIVDRRDFGILVENADDQRNWRETIILAAGLANQLEAEDLIEKLLRRFDKTSDVGVLFLAVGCLESTVSMTDLVKRMLEERLQAISPPRNIAEARALASAGDLVVPFLSGVSKMKGAAAVASVTALVMIGTDAAFKVLQRVWKQETRVRVWRRLIDSATQWPDPDKYLNAVMPPIADIRYDHRGRSWVTVSDGRQFPSHKLPLAFLMRLVRERRVERVVVFVGGRPEVLSQLRASGYGPVQSTDSWTRWGLGQPSRADNPSEA